MRAKLIRYGLAVGAAGLVAVLSIILTLYLVVDTKEVLRFLESNANQYLGIHLRVTDLEFNPFRGFSARGIRVSAGDQKPTLLDISRVDVTYDPWAILYGTVRVTHVKLTGVNANITRENGVWNLPEMASASTNTAESGAGEGGNVVQAAAINSATRLAELTKVFFIPFRVVIKDVGFERLNLLVEDKDARVTLSKVTDANLRVDLVGMGSGLRADVKAGFRELLNGKTRIGEIAALAQIKLSASSRENKILVEHLDLEIPGFVTSKSRAFVRATVPASPDISYDVSSVTKLKAEIPPALRDVVGADLSTRGDVSVELSAAGKLNPDDPNLAMAKDNIGLLAPDHLKIAMIARKIGVNVKSVGISMEPADAETILNVQKNQDSRLEYKLTSSNDLPSVTIAFRNSEALTAAAIKNTRIGFESAGMWPPGAETKADLKLKSDAVDLIGPNGAETGMPIEFSASLRDQDGGHASTVKAMAAIGHEIKASLGIDCQLTCSQFEIDVEQSIPSFDALWKKARPLLATSIPAKFQPEILQGGQIFKATAKGTRSDTLEKTAARTAVEAEFGIQGFNVALSEKSGEINNGSVRVGITGALTGASVSSSVTSGPFKWLLSQRGKKQDMMSGDGVKIVSKTTTRNLKSGMPAKLSDFLISSDLSLAIQNLIVPGVPVKTPADPDLKLKASLERGEHAAISELALNIPSLGVKASGQGDFDITKDGLPRNVRLDIDSQVSERVGALIPSYIFQGSVATHTRITSESLEEVTASGYVDLNSVTIEVPQKSGNPIRIDNANGALPYLWTIDLKPGTKAGSDGGTNQSALAAQDDASLRRLASIQLEKMNPIERRQGNMVEVAEFGSVRDFVSGGQRPLTIAAIKSGSIGASDIEINAVIKKNFVLLNSMTAKIFGGHLSATAMVEYLGRPTKLKCGMHLTRFNTEDLVRTVPGLRKKSRGLFGTTNPYIDASARLQYDLLSADMSGSLDITSIGKDQLRMLMYYLDPTDSDRSISTIKAALNVGEVKMVSVPVKNGEIDVDVDVRLVSTPVPVPKIQGFPIAKLISNFQNQEETDSDEAH